MISSLHQNAPSNAASKKDVNGPDQVIKNLKCNWIKLILKVLDAERYNTSRRDLPVKLRREEKGVGAEQPISVQTMLQVRNNL